jgi:protocatechuate 3,4-dioxygenase alpha subunit
VAARTPSQTVGPFFHEALRWPAGPAPDAPVTIAGRVLDGAGEAVDDAMIEAWQSGSCGLARVMTDADGTFRLAASMPRGEAPCLEVAIFARGLLKAVRTRVYLAPIGRVRADPALAALAGSPRIGTLVATPAGAHEYRWDARLQGDGETVFFCP